MHDAIVGSLFVGIAIMWGAWCIVQALDDVKKALRQITIRKDGV